MLDTITLVVSASTLVLSYATRYALGRRVKNTLDEYENKEVGPPPLKIESIFRSVLGIMFERRMMQVQYSAVFIVFSLAIYIALTVFGIIEADWIIQLLLVGAAFLVFFKQLIISYRVRNGFFGSSEYEVREFISYILREASHSDIYDDMGRPRKLVDPAEFIQQIKAVNPSWNPQINPLGNPR